MGGFGRFVVCFVALILFPQGNFLAEDVACVQDGATKITDVATGIDVLQAERFARLRGVRVGLITNQTGINREGMSTASILQAAPEVNLVALFSPEHGIQGALDQSVIEDSHDPETGLRIHSLYGASRKPTKESLRGLDVLLFDIQDIGTRFYTYISTMGLAMEAAAERGLRFMVLDRPNPINGVDVGGPMLDAGRESFVAYHNVPIRHGLTVGEMARLFKGERKLDLDLEVVCVQGWTRKDFFDATGLLWVNPSPNMRCLNQALLYPGIGLLETTNLSVGRGTDTPFEVIGAPWLDGRKLAQCLNDPARELAGVRLVPIRFTPDASKFKGELCGGINIMITDRSAFEPLRTGLEIARQLRRMYPRQWDVARYLRLLGNQRTLQAVMDGKTIAEIETISANALDEFKRRRAAFLLYE